MDKALYVLAEFDKETQETLRGYYETLVSSGIIGTQTKDIPYHFTLGIYPIEDEAGISDKLDSICADVSGITVRFGHIGLFGLNVLFLAPNVTRELLELHDRLSFENSIEQFPWTPHATLLIDEPETIVKALPLVVEQLQPLTARIDKIGFYEFFPKRLIREYGLK